MKETLKEALEEYTGDAYLYFGSVNQYGYDRLSTLLETRSKKNSQACLVLITTGGSADYGYRIARAIRHHYENFNVIIPDICKSAGTLICIGADELVFGDRGELGPLDVQIMKPDEMFESMSGLDLSQALLALQNQVLSAFREYLVDIRGGAGLQTKLAADIAEKLTEGFVAPIAAKVDPLTLGEHQRAMQIGYAYGKRLNETSHILKEGALQSLISDYPSHGFVIDRKEARDLFNNVSRPKGFSTKLYLWGRDVLKKCDISRGPLVVDLRAHIDKNTEVEKYEKNESNRKPKVKGNKQVVPQASSGKVSNGDKSVKSKVPSNTVNTDGAPDKAKSKNKPLTS